MSTTRRNSPPTFDFKITQRVISSILIPTDFSPASWNATQVALELSRLNSDLVISLLHIYPNSSRYTHKNNLLPENKLDEVRGRMNQLAQGLLDHSEDKIKNVVLSGNVEDTLLQFIKEHDFDLVIVGINSNGQNNDIGSHTVSVIKESGVPVMIVPNKLVDGAIAS
ncbi:universal stress protein [Ekhidna sp.]|uniref:universal stress protein n=1 Tax=Ekhidna sp. TaxID=2608089 RepID=UPI003BAD5B16